ncbi:MAG: hypothetical protein IKC89_07310 [Lentisphaeria bacterium]|nr:hypothetical protein [Lentisphaeria bacterium]
MRKAGKYLIALALFITAAVSSAAVLRTGSGGQVKTLDPVRADDLASRDLTALVYDTLLQYDYLKRPYTLKPSMLTAMPEVSADFTRFEFELRDDLYFHPDACFPDRNSRKVTADDVKFSLLRFADARLHSPVYWMFRGKIRELEKFRNASSSCSRDDWRPYELDIAGIKVISERRFVITLTKPDPRFLYMLAMPNAGIVSRKAGKFYGTKLGRHPVGSGPFILREWVHNLRLEFTRNPEFRTEFFPGAENPADRKKALPLLDGISIFQIRQPMTAWMMFLQGRLDLNALDKDNLETMLSGNVLIPALKRRQVQLVSNPEFEIRYIGFNFADPKLKDNLKLRQALSLSYNVSRRVSHAGGQLLPVQTAIPPGVAGYDKDYINPFAVYDLERAKQLLAEAGYPGGIDPATGKALELTFDQSGNDTAHRQMGELAVDDWRKLGINVVSVLNSKPRFFEKLRQKRFQLFRLSWVGDYPDAENFLQLFYSGNAGSCNRTGFSDRQFDLWFEESVKLPDSPRRDLLYSKMAKLAAEKCAWIYEGIPVSSVLYHGFLENYHECDFSFVRWKYLNVNEKLRRKLLPSFRPLSFSELAGK